MAIAIRLDVRGVDEARAYFRRLGRQLPARTIPDALVEIGLAVQREATENQIIRGGGRDAPVDPVRLTSRTGTLRRSIRVNRRGLPRYVDVGSDLVYFRPHELGDPGRNLPARPVLAPAAREVERRGTPRQVMNKHLRRAIEGSPV